MHYSNKHLTVVCRAWCGTRKQNDENALPLQNKIQTHQPLWPQLFGSCQISLALLERVDRSSPAAFSACPPMPEKGQSSSQVLSPKVMLKIRENNTEQRKVSEFVSCSNISGVWGEMNFLNKIIYNYYFNKLSLLFTGDNTILLFLFKMYHLSHH